MTTFPARLLGRLTVVLHKRVKSRDHIFTAPLFGVRADRADLIRSRPCRHIPISSPLTHKVDLYRFAAISKGDFSTPRFGGTWGRRWAHLIAHGFLLAPIDTVYLLPF